MKFDIGKKVVLTVSMLLCIGSASLATDNVEICDKIDHIVKNQLPEGTDASIVVYDLTNDDCIYGYREDVLCRPASIMKIMTSTTALSCLGHNFTFDTKLCITGTIDPDSTLHGDLYVVGGLDPAFMEQDMLGMISDLTKAGIKKINGSVIADVSIMDSVYWGSGWCWDDAPSSFQPYISPLMVHEGYVGISVTPTSKGEAPTVSIYPSNRFIKVINTALTKDNSLEPLTISRDWINNDNTIIVSGNCTETQATDLSVVGSSDFFFSLFKEYLSDYGIIAENFGWGKCPSGAYEIVTVSHGLKPIINEALKESNNLYAEAMFLQLGRLSKPDGVSFKDAAEYEELFIRRTLKSKKESFNIADGCGLSMYDYVSSTLVVDMLKHIYKDPLLYDVFYDCLPVSGIDGTLRGRLSNSKTIGKIRAKTGSVTGSCTLAGYAEGEDGRIFAFCIMNEGAIKMAPSRKVQDAICHAICE
jgi:serine-type D-Ala-D-Ala carboxypeptidase/endopeptidase (penicillin-binding protein 4)